MRWMQATAITAAMLLIACNDRQSDSQGTIVADTQVAGSSALSVSKVQVQGIAGGVSGRRDFSGPPVATPVAVEETSAALQPSPSQGTDPLTVQIAPTMVIRNGQASVEVDRLDPSIVKLRQLAAQLGGYIANSSMSGGRDQIRSATLELKIPAQRFDQALNGLATLGKVESVNATAEDIGEEFVDITARVNNAHRLEDRLIALLATRTGKLQDVLSVERELARVREEIERYEGRLRYLKSRVATSTLSVTVHEPLPILGQEPGQNPIVAAIRRAWRNFVGFIAGGIAALGVLIPLTLLALAGWVIYKRVRRKRAE
jgi:hypothetical protein